MKKYLLYLLLIPIGLIACEKAKEPGFTPGPAPVVPSPSPATTIPGQQTTGLSGKYALYMKVDTFYNYYLATKADVDVTHETLTGDTFYLKAGTPNQVVQPNAITGYDPKSELADTLNFTSAKGGTEIYPSYSESFTYDLPAKVFNKLYNPGTSARIFKIDEKTVEVVTTILDPDNNTLTYTYASYFKKL